jgi:hypothetical protein
MLTGLDLRRLVAGMADRRPGRTEANVQSDLHTLLLTAALDLGERDLTEVVLESPAGARRRIDVEVGSTVFEVKRDLRVGNVRVDAVEQLAGYVRSRTRELRQRYVGVLTDGAEWHLYHLVGDDLALVSSHVVDPASPDVEVLTVWLEGVLATAEKITPTPLEIERRLGATSPAHALDFAELSALYAAHRDDPGVVLKRQLWAQLLTTALGDAFTPEDDLFVEHTLLVATAEVIAHAVVGFDPTDPSISPATLLGGQLFADAQIGGVVESDFFDWPIETPDGGAWVRTLARRLARFTWGTVEHDLMKVLYESVIAAPTRHHLGEYYTPDWLAQTVVEEVVTDPLNQRVLDPACGSGTFLFHAVRRYLAAADAAGLDTATAITGATRAVAGMDVHPVAVTFARVTYLLALGRDRLVAENRPAFTVPVYLGDSVQWGQADSLLTGEALTVSTGEGLTLFAGELVFPERLLDDAGRFDQLVSELAHKAVDRPPHTTPPSLTATFRRHAVHPDDQATISRTFSHMCELQDAGRNHIWGYYVRNLARPTWLARPGNQVDVLVGNPPWLAYRYMTAAMKADFRAMSEARSIWAGAGVATHQDLSGLFTARAVELYLRDGGRFAMVMPLAVLSRHQFAGFRTGQWGSRIGELNAALDTPWDLHQVKPSFFPVPAAVVFGTKAAAARALPEVARAWSGRLRGRNLSLAQAREHLMQGAGAAVDRSAPVSPWAARFAQGATLSPRVLVLVEDAASNPLGAGAGRRAVRSHRSTNEKQPWKTLGDLAGTIERQFIRPVHLGDTVLPYRPLTPLRGVIPWDGTRLLSTAEDRLEDYPGLAAWTRTAEQTWLAHRTAGSTLTFLERLDYQRGLRQQLPVAPHRVVYSKSGMYLAAAYIADASAVINNSLYWATVTSTEEGRFLSAILNSDVLLQVIRPLQNRGEHNPRHFDKYVFQAPIPLYNPNDEAHRHLAGLAERAEAVAAAVELPAGVAFQALRRRIRQALDADTVGKEIEVAVADLLTLQR